MTANVVFGATRWDAWWSHATGAPALETVATVSPNQYQFRAPIHSQVLGDNVVTFITTQATFDNEITFANSCGLDYWAYLLYPNNDPMNAGIDFHISSSIASLQKYCLMIPTDGMGSTGSSNYQPIIDTIASKYINQSFYYTFSDGVPLVYIYYTATDIANRWSGNIANLKAAIDYLKTKFLALKGHNPYVVVLCGADNTTLTSLGCDALSNYISGFSRLIDGTYAQLDTSTQNYWTSMATTVGGSGNHIVPICMMGWNGTPRKSRPESFSAQNGQIIPEQGMRSAYAYATNTELANHVQAAVTYLNNNPTITPRRTILTYAWNENNEGGWLTKTLGDPTGTRLQAIAPVIA